MSTLTCPVSGTSRLTHEGVDALYGSGARHARRPEWIDRVRRHEPQWPDADQPDARLRLGVGCVIFPLTRPGVVSTGLFGVRLRCNDFMFSPARTHAYKATMPAAAAGATTAASPVQGAVKG